MFNDKKIRLYVFFFLGFCVFTSKSVIIYNEETLVALSFCIFVLFCFHYLGDTVKESLDERGSTIKTELQNFLQYRQESLTELSKEHKRISQLQSVLPSIGAFTREQLSTLSVSGEQTLALMFAQQLEQKLASLSSSRGALQQRLQSLIASNIQALVLTKIKSDKRSAKEGRLNTRMIQTSIKMLGKASQTY